MRDASSVLVHSGRAARTWPVAAERWKALVDLDPGVNYVSITSGDATTYLTMSYQPQTNPRVVRLVIALASDDDELFDAPFGEPDDLATARRRLAFAGQLLQSAVADRQAEDGLGRRTFRLERDGAGAIETRLMRTDLTTAQWFALQDADPSGVSMFYAVYDRLNQLPACADCTTLVLLGMTQFDAATNKARAHTALGGGRLAVFGSGTLYAWADGLDDLQATLADARYVSTASPRVFDDSGGRGTWWANSATALGALMHEVGHAMDLPHALQPAEMMNRGFDQISRLFVMREPPSAGSAGIDAILPHQEARFAFANARRLRHHRGLALDATAYTVNAPPTMTRSGDTITIQSAAGVRTIGYAVPRDGGDWRIVGGNYDGSPNPPTLTTVTLGTLRLLFPTEPSVRLFITDDQGNISDTPANAPISL